MSERKNTAIKKPSLNYFIFISRWGIKTKVSCGNRFIRECSIDFVLFCFVFLFKSFLKFPFINTCKGGPTVKRRYLKSFAA